MRSRSGFLGADRRTPLAPAPGRGKAGPNQPSTKFWHQGFIVSTVPDLGPVVLFRTEETAARIAIRATTNTKRPMEVLPVGDLWAYRVDPEEGL